MPHRMLRTLLAFCKPATHTDSRHLARTDGLNGPLEVGLDVYTMAIHARRPVCGGRATERERERAERDLYTIAVRLARFMRRSRDDQIFRCQPSAAESCSARR